jgi:O-glycosyl hydrolase
MRLLPVILFIVSLYSYTLNAQTLAAFEDGAADLLSISEEWYDTALFIETPEVYPNPDTTGINKSAKCFGATNIADADWWGNFVCLNLDSTIMISEENRFLSFRMYRSIQPKEVRISINGKEESDGIYFGKASMNETWEEVLVDLLPNYNGKELNTLWIIFSCNWYDPRTGWGEASYYFDDFELKSSSTLSYSVSIDLSGTYQEIDGFGASDCWAGNYVGQWSETPRSLAAGKLFSQEFDSIGNPEGIGLSMWRFNLGAGTYEQGESSGIDDVSRRAECFLDNTQNYNWSKQAGQQYFLKQAQSYGCEHFVAFSNSPLTIYTKNGKGFADPGGECNLKDDNFDDYADYITTVLKHFADEEGIEFSYISPVNEPQYDWTGGQEGSPWANSDIKNITSQLDASIQSKGLNTKILLAEAGSWQYLYKNNTWAGNQIFELFNSSSSNYIGNLNSVAPIICGHSYWTFKNNTELKEVRENVRNYTEFNLLKPYQTEWSLLDAEPEVSTGFPSSYSTASYMDIALFMAKVIQSDLCFANVSSWSFWTAMDIERWGHKNRFLLIRVTPSDGVDGSILNSGTTEDTPTLWALGNFSLFIRPGYTRIKIDGADNMNELFGSAYISPDTNRIVVVYVNTSYSDIYLSTGFSNLEKNITSVKKYVTSSISNLERDFSLSESYSNDTIIIPNRAVTTIIYDLNDKTSGLDEIEQQTSGIQIYPNPVRRGSSIMITSIEQDLLDNVTIELLTVGGRLIKRTNSQLISEKYQFIVPEDIPVGTYMLNFKNRNKNYNQKIVAF